MADGKYVSTLSGPELDEALRAATSVRTTVRSELQLAKESGKFNGKSAYEYAQDGGFSGTEDEFADKLASGVVFVGDSSTPYLDYANAYINGNVVFHKENYAGGSRKYLAAMIGGGKGEFYCVTGDGAIHCAVLNNGEWSYKTREEQMFIGDANTTVAQYYEAYSTGKTCFMRRQQGGSGTVTWVASQISTSYAHFYNITSTGEIQYGFLDSENIFTQQTANADVSAGNVFIGNSITTVAQYYEAYSAGKACFMRRGGAGGALRTWVLDYCTPNFARFYHIHTDFGSVEYGNLSSDGTWTYETAGSQSASIDVTAEVGQTIIVKAVDANGKPTEWKAVEYPIVFSEIIPQTVVTPEYEVDLGAYAWIIANDTVLQAGKKYTVIFDGTEYTCTAKDAVYNGVSLTFAGNGVLIGEDTGEPFCFASVQGNDGYIIMMGFDGNEHTISMAKNELHQAYLPANAYPYCVHVSAEYYENGGIKGLTCAESGQTLLNLYRSGRGITLKMNRPDTDSRLWWIYHLASEWQLENGTIALIFTAGQIANGSQLPTIHIFIAADGQMVLEALHHS